MPPKGKAKVFAEEAVEEEEVDVEQEQGTPQVIGEPELEPEDVKSSVISLSDLISAMKSFREPSEKLDKAAPELRKPEPFTGKDPKKLKAFLFQCQLYFRSSSAFEDDANKVTFALSYLREVAQDWFEPGITGQLPEPPDWLTNWELFIGELQRNFGPFDESADLEHELSSLYMRDNQQISDYLVRFNSAAVRLPWGEPALRYRFYEGLPARIKDEIMKGDGKPSTLHGLREKAQNIDARYWERQQERSREQRTQPQRPQPAKQPASSSYTPAATPSTAPRWTNTPKPQPADQKPKFKDSAKPATPKIDLSGKLDSRGRLTQPRTTIS